MSFSIFARGTGGYHHQRNHADEGDVYDLATALGRIGAMSGGVRGVVENEVAGAVPNSDGGLLAALNTMGTMQMMDLLVTNFTLALARSGQMRVSITARSPGLISTGPSRNLTALYSTRDNTPVRNFISDLTPTLEAADLNRFMVIGAIAQVFGMWNGRAAPRGEHMINMEITAT